MIAMTRHLLVGSVCMLAAIGIASCSSDELGSTLSVTAVDNSPQYVAGGKEFDGNPIIVYHGEKDLSYSWTIESGGSASITGISDKTPKFTFDDLGAYVVSLTVYESEGTLSKTSKGTYVVSSFAPIDITASQTAFTGTNNISGQVSGTSTLSVVATGGKKPYTYLWSGPTGPTVSIGSPGSSTTTVTFTNATPGSYTFTVTVRDGESPAQSATQILTIVAVVTSG